MTIILSSNIQKIILDKSASKKCLFESFRTIALLLQPFTPHLSEEMWKKLGENKLAISEKWPKINEKIIKKTNKIAIQINGKTKEIIEFSNGASKEEVQNIALKNKKIEKLLENKKISKVIFVPERVLNIVLY